MKNFREYLAEVKLNEKEIKINESTNNDLLSAIIPIIDNIISKFGKNIDEHTYKFETFKVVWNEDDERYEYYSGNDLAFTAIFKNNDNTDVKSYTILDEVTMCEMLSITLKGKYRI